MAVFLYPVRTDPPGDSSQDMAGQVRHPDPGQDQKPHVVGQEVEVYLSCISIPADKVISGGTLPGRRAKEKAGQRIMPPVKNHVLHVLSDSAAKTKDNGSEKANTGRAPEDQCPFGSAQDRLQPTGPVPV